MGHKILLADDSITIQKVIELTFTDEDFELHTVGNGQKAIEEIRSVKPDIVLCDIIMPEKSGYEVCEHIKTSDDLKHIPVLLLTGAFEPFDQERAKKAGCDGFLAKPFEPQTLISKVKELLQATASAKPAAAPSLSSTVQTQAAAPPPPPPAAPPVEEAEDATVMMSPGMAPPVSPPTPTPASPDATASHDEAGFQESLAQEAGERALSVDADDRTMFLGQAEDASGGADDIWNEVQGGPSAPSPPAPPEDEGQTVMMSSPIVPEPVEPEAPPAPGVEDLQGSDDFSGGFTELPATPTEEPAGDDAWVIPGPDPTAESAEPELTPLGDFGGFDDFSAEPAKPAESFDPTKPSKKQASPPAIPSPGSPPSPINESAPDADATAQPWGEPLVPPTAKPVSAPSPPSPPPSPVVEPTPVEPTPVSPTPVASSSPAEQPAKPAAPPVGAPVDMDMDALADRIAKKVLSQLSEKVIQEIAWEVVPDLAEALIQKEIEEIKAKIPK